MVKSDMIRELHQAQEVQAPIGLFIMRRYEIEDGLIMPLSKRPRRLLYPMGAPGVVSEFARLEPGDQTALKTFANRWGLLGYDAMRGAANPSAARLGGDPVAWVWAHARGVRTVLRLNKLLRRGDAFALEEELGQLSVTRKAAYAWQKVNDALDKGNGVAETVDLVDDLFSTTDDYMTDLEIAVISGHGPRLAFTMCPRLPGRDSRAPARRWIWNIVNPNLRGYGLEISDNAPTEQLAKQGGPFLVWRFDSLLSAIYRHVANIIVGKRVAVCVECGILFVQKDARQRFCPPEEGGKGSRCGAAWRKREKRKET